MANSIAYGFLSLKDVFANRVTQLNTGVLNNALVQSAAEWTRLMDQALMRLATRTTLASERYRLPGSGSLQPIDQWGNPLPVKGGAYYTVGYPIQGGGTAWGNNRVSREMMSVEDANQYTVDAQRRDADWLIRHMLAALFTNVTYTFTDDTRPEDPTITVQPLANADGTLFPIVGGDSDDVTHYLAQAAAIDDDHDPFLAVFNALRVHPSNAGRIVSYIPSNLTDDVGGMTDFVDVGDPDILLGDQSDRIVGNMADIQGFGDRVLGKMKGTRQWIVEWSRLPDNYIYSQAIDAPDSPLAMREYPSAALQGLFPEAYSPDGNRAEYRFLRYAGFGARNRVSAAITRIGSGSYGIPAGYTAPLAA